MPFAAASTTFEAVRSTLNSTLPAVADTSLSGFMTLAIRKAAGADRTDAARR